MCTYVSTVTSNCQDNQQVGMQIAKMMPNPIAVLRFQFLGSHHHPPEGDHTYFG